MRPVQMITQILWLLVAVACSMARLNRKWTPSYERKTTQITDFRYNSAQVDGITRLFNDSWVVISNGHYWTLRRGELPRAHNVQGSISQLYPKFDRIDSIWTDPYNDISPQIYLVFNTARDGLRVVCQEFSEPFTDSSSFCHLPVDTAWKNALKDLDFDRPIDAVTWRNRTKDKDGGFWVFFQGSNMITIDPYEMRLRFTYDITKWMSINETITAVYYDYHSHVYHLFFERNLYRTWKVNVTFMNNLPMSWDRAFLHGTLSPPLKINRDFFGFSQYETFNRPQPNFEKVFHESEVTRSKVKTNLNNSNKSTTTTTTADSISDVIYLTDTNNIRHSEKPNSQLKQFNTDQTEHIVNSVEHDYQEASYQRQLSQMQQEEVLDFGRPEVNGAHFDFVSYLPTLLNFCALLFFLTLC